MSGEPAPSWRQRTKTGFGEFFHIWFVLLAGVAVGGLAVGLFLALHVLTNSQSPSNAEQVWLFPALALEGIGIFFWAALTTALKLGERHLYEEELPTARVRLRKLRLRFTAGAGAVIVLGSVLALHGGHWRRFSQWTWLILGLVALAYSLHSWLDLRKRNAG